MFTADNAPNLDVDCGQRPTTSWRGETRGQTLCGFLGMPDTGPPSLFREIDPPRVAAGGHRAGGPAGLHLLPGKKRGGQLFGRGLDAGCGPQPGRGRTVRPAPADALQRLLQHPEDRTRRHPGFGGIERECDLPAAGGRPGFPGHGRGQAPDRGAARRRHPGLDQAASSPARCAA